MFKCINIHNDLLYVPTIFGGQPIGNLCAKGGNHMAFDKNKPIEFDLPDGNCHVMTTEYFMEMMTPILNQIITSIEANVASLTSINATVQRWLDDQS